MSNLEQLAREGFTSTAIEAAVNTIEFGLRENNTGSFPRGLSLMLRAAAAWIYDLDPLEPLQWTDDLQRFKVLTLLQAVSTSSSMLPLSASLPAQQPLPCKCLLQPEGWLEDQRRSWREVALGKALQVVLSHQCRRAVVLPCIGTHMSGLAARA